MKTTYILYYDEENVRRFYSRVLNGFSKDIHNATSFEILSEAIQATKDYPHLAGCEICVVTTSYHF